MKATELLKDQHKEVKSLFKRIEKSKENREKAELFEELAQNLVGHDAIEREIFYPACKKAMGMTELLGEAMVEHGVVEFSLYLADQARGKDDFDYKMTVLSEMVEHHVKEEEDDFFPKVEKALGDEALEALGEQMEARFGETQEEDFRAPLHKNLRMVLEGASDLGKGQKGAAKSAAKSSSKQGTTKGAAKKSGSHAGRLHS